MDNDKRTIYCDGEYVYFVTEKNGLIWHDKPVFYFCAISFDGAYVSTVFPNKSNPKTPLRHSFKEAQTDLDDWAEKQNLQRFEAVT